MTASANVSADFAAAAALRALVADLTGADGSLPERPHAMGRILAESLGFSDADADLLLEFVADYDDVAHTHRQPRELVLASRLPKRARQLESDEIAAELDAIFEAHERPAANLYAGLSIRLSAAGRDRLSRLCTTTSMTRLLIAQLRRVLEEDRGRFIDTMEALAETRKQPAGNGSICGLSSSGGPTEPKKFR